MDALRVYVVFDQNFPEGTELYKALVTGFDRIGMHREGFNVSVPVLRRSVPWGTDHDGLSGQHPALIDLERARRNVVLLLCDPVMTYRCEPWSEYVELIRAGLDERKSRAGVALDLLIPVLVDGTQPPFERLTQAIRLSAQGVLNDERTRIRILIQLLNAILVHRDPVNERDASGAGHPIFVSHAKVDGGAIASQIVQLIDRVNESLGPRCFFDADSLLPGDDYHQTFSDSIEHGSLLVVATSAYHTRPWCRWEVLRAKAFGRPMVVADLADERIERSFPYLGNVPTVRVQATPTARTLPDDAVERLTLALLSESLRIGLWLDRARDVCATDDHLCSRPPELSDLALITAKRPIRVLYPDPPLSSEEIELLTAGYPDVQMRTLSQVIA